MSGYAQRGFDPEVKKFLNFIGVIVGLACYWVLRALGVPMPVLLIVFVIAVAAGGIRLGDRPNFEPLRRW